MKPLRLWIVAAAAFTLPAWAAADSITEWNERTFACTVMAKQGPYPASRALAMVHVAMFDAAANSSISTVTECQGDSFVRE